MTPIGSVYRRKRRVMWRKSFYYHICRRFTFYLFRIFPPVPRTATVKTKCPLLYLKCLFEMLTQKTQGASNGGLVQLDHLRPAIGGLLPRLTGNLTNLAGINNLLRTRFHVSTRGLSSPSHEPRSENTCAKSHDGTRAW